MQTTMNDWEPEKARQPHKALIGVPGAGKTTFLMKLVVERLKTKPDLDWLYLSYTRASIADAVDTMQEMAKEQGIKVTKAGLGKHIRTMDAICMEHARIKRLVNYPGGKHDVTKEFFDEYKIDFDRYVGDELVDATEAGAQGLPEGNRYLSAWEYTTACMWDMDRIAASGEFLKNKFGIADNDKSIALMVAYWEYKVLRHSRDFSDLRVEIVKNKIVLKHELLICDEFQDYGQLQYAVFKTLSSGCREVYVAGDPLQSIYGFNSASPEFLITHTEERTILNKTYRFGSITADFANSLVRQMNYGFAYEQPEILPNMSVDDTVTIVHQNSYQETWDRVRTWMHQTEGCKEVYLLARTNAIARRYAGFIVNHGISVRDLRTDKLYGSFFRMFYNFFGKVATMSDTPLTVSDQVRLTGVLDIAIPATMTATTHEIMACKTYCDMKLLMSRYGIERMLRMTKLSGIQQQTLKSVFYGILPPEFPEDGWIYAGACHSAKGLTSDMTLFVDTIPVRVLKELENDTDSNDVLEEEKRLVYTACTRHRRHLLVLKDGGHNYFGEVFVG